MRSPAYDLNPNEYGTGPSLNITESDNSLDTGHAMEVADFFRLSHKKAGEVIKKISKAVTDWKKIAVKNKIPPSEIKRMERTFG